MDEFIFDIRDKKISRLLPKSWGYVAENIPNNWIDVPAELGHYCKKLYQSLVAIQKYNKREFNSDNTYSIEDYIAIFNSIYNKIISLLIDKSYYKQKLKYRENQIELFDEIERFDVFYNIYLNYDSFQYNSDGDAIAFEKNIYVKVRSLVNKMFMLEKMCSFTTRKFWQEEMTNINNLDVKKPFKILVKVITPYPWRHQKSTTRLLKYFNGRIYASASLIDQNHTKSLFDFYDRKVVAALIVDFEDKNLICADKSDTFSEEYINNKNPLCDKALYSDIFLQSNENVNGVNHKLYANAVETITPSYILNNVASYSEVNVKNPKIVGVLAPNKESLLFCQQQAEERKLKLFIPENVK